MASDAIGAVNKGETLLIIGGVIVLGYFVYQASESFSDWINNLFGLTDAAAQGNTYTNALSQSVAHPITTASTIVGGWWDDLTGVNSQSELPSALSSVGYTKIGASGQHWSCSGPQGASNDVCVPVTVDASGNMTQTGNAVSATSAN